MTDVIADDVVLKERNDASKLELNPCGELFEVILFFCLSYMSVLKYSF